MSDIEFPTVREVMNMSGGPDTVFARGWASEGDLGRNSRLMLDRMQSVGHADERIHIRSHDGEIYVPYWGPVERAPNGVGPTDEAWADITRRADTFIRPPSDLVWDSTRAAPGGYGGTHIVWQNTTKPYPITCSNFLMLLLMGVTWESSTYVQPNTRNTPVPGAYGFEGATQIALQASYMLRSFATRGYVYKVNNLWMARGGGMGTIQRGDILFFSKPNPENSWERVKAGTLNAYPWNVYHVALYLGDGMIMHSTHPGSATAVYKQPLAPLILDLVYIARIPWVKVA